MKYTILFIFFSYIFFLDLQAMETNPILLSREETAWLESLNFTSQFHSKTYESYKVFFFQEFAGMIANYAYRVESLSILKSDSETDWQTNKILATELIMRDSLTAIEKHLQKNLSLLQLNQDEKEKLLAIKSKYFLNKVNIKNCQNKLITSASFDLSDSVGNKINLVDSSGAINVTQNIYSLRTSITNTIDAYLNFDHANPTRNCYLLLDEYEKQLKSIQSYTQELNNNMEHMNSLTSEKINESIVCLQKKIFDDYEFLLNILLALQKNLASMETKNLIKRKILPLKALLESEIAILKNEKKYESFFVNNIEFMNLIDAIRNAHTNIINL